MNLMILISIISLLLSFSSAFEVSPASPNPGDRITITGSASPNQEVSLQSSFSMNLPVAGGRYEYATKVTVPQKPNRIIVTARNVQDFNAGVKMVIWITKGFPPSGGTVSLSQADVPPGEYNLKMFGAALPGSTAVPVSVKAETKVKADSQGRYSLDMDTSGIPAGEYRIEAAGESRTIRLGPEAASIKGSQAEATEIIEPTPTQEITPHVVLWYANKTGLDINNQSHIERAEKLLNKRLEDGYWKIIARGEPLTEEAGSCLQDYCLVRGTGACTSCRDKDILLKGSQPVVQNPASSDSISESRSHQESEEEGLWGRIKGWIGSIAGGGGVQ